MTTLIRPLATIAGLFLVLTYLLLRGEAPDLHKQELRLSLIDSIVLDQAALERDALQVRAGLLANYDALVDGAARLRANVQRLQAMRSDWPDAPEGLSDLRRASFYHSLLYAAAICHLSIFSCAAMPPSWANTLRPWSLGPSANRQWPSFRRRSSTRRRSRLTSASEEGLARLGRHLQVDHAYLVVADETGQAERALVWSAAGPPKSSDWPLNALGLLNAPELIALERDGCIVIPWTEDLPAADARAALEAQGVKAWLGVTLWQVGGGSACLRMAVVRLAVNLRHGSLRLPMASPTCPRRMPASSMSSIISSWEELRPPVRSRRDAGDQTDSAEQDRGNGAPP